jgi:pimeloyl-ACP methyl ester carboxylesterase
VLTHNATSERLKAIGESIPCAAIVGTKDKMIDPSCTDELGRRIPGCKVVKLEGKGHGIPTESEFELIKLMEEMYAV